MATPPEPNPRLVAEVLARASDTGAYDAWAAQVRRAGNCCRPVRLVGTSATLDTATGEVLHRYRSDNEPEGVLLKACGTRRETLCPACAGVYRSDAFQLVAAGIRGGKGVPDSVAGHPAAFVTLTAPSFGVVHVHRGPTDLALCRAAPARSRCAHGRPLACGAIHSADDPILGEPLCPECFDYTGAVLWNALASELWRRTTIYLRRSLARAAPTGTSDSAARMAFTKVVEYQRRGVIHVHAIIRVDGAGSTASLGEIAPPPGWVNPETLAAVICATVPQIGVPWPRDDGHGPARWGTQLDIQTIAGHEPASRNVAAYLAKYSTKSTEPEGLLDHRLRGLAELDRDELRPHLRRLVTTAWQLGAEPELDHLRLRHWAHALGFRGHWSTRSKYYSTTFGALRRARAKWNLDRDLATGGGLSLASGHNDAPQPKQTTVADWTLAGIGYRSGGDAWLAATAAESARHRRLVARQEISTGPRGSAFEEDATGTDDHETTATARPDQGAVGDNVPNAADERKRCNDGEDQGDGPT